ncbi:MAG: hypothetical protein ACI4VQ_03465, partial [Clostridia bacterium]
VHLFFIEFFVAFQKKILDKLVEAIDDIAFEMEQIFSQQIFFIPNIMKETIKSNLRSIKTKVQETFKPDELKKIYREFFSNMSNDFVKDVGNVCVGYSMNRHLYRDGHSVSLYDVATNAKSINEMLHLLHSYVCNNEAVFRSMPIIEKKNISRYGNCTLFGLSNDIARDIFDSFPTGSEYSELGETYIIGLDDRVLMMVRDMGHALTIDIKEDKEKGTAFVTYFIPKICNPEKLNKLKGIHKVPITQDWKDMSASGMYEASIENFGMDMVNFIEQVPTDVDMDFSPKIEAATPKVQDTVGHENTSPSPETEIKNLANMDIRANITESDIRNAEKLLSWLKEKANKSLNK